MATKRNREKLSPLAHSTSPLIFDQWETTSRVDFLPPHFQRSPVFNSERQPSIQHHKSCTMLSEMHSAFTRKFPQQVILVSTSDGNPQLVKDLEHRMQVFKRISRKPRIRFNPGAEFRNPTSSPLPLVSFFFY